MGYTKAKGTLLKMTIATVLTTIAQMLEFEAPERKKNKMETTGLTDGTETSLPGITRTGVLKGTCFMDPAAATHAAILSQFLADTVDAFNIVYQDAGAAVDAFTGYFSSLQATNIKIDGLVMYKFEITETAANTFTP